MALEKPSKFVRRTRAERQREIAEVTLRLVAKYGVHGTTISRISAAVGLSRAALYRHFRNREAVLKAAVDLMVKRSPSWIGKTSGENALEHIINMGDTHASWAAGEFETFIHPLFQFAAASNRRGGYSDELRDAHLMFIEAFRELVEAGKQDGSIRQEVDSTEVAVALMMFAWAEDVARLVGMESLVTEGASKAVFRRMLSGIGASDRAKTPD